MLELTPLPLLLATIFLIGQITMGVGQQARGAITYYSSKSKEAAAVVISFETSLGTFIDSSISDLAEKYATVGQEKLETISQTCKASIPANYSAPLMQEIDKKLVEIVNIDLEILAVVNVCRSSVAPLLSACSTSQAAAEAKLTLVISASERDNLDRLCNEASSQSKTYLGDCFSKGVELSASQ